MVQIGQTRGVSLKTIFLDNSINRSILLVYISILLIIVFLQQEFIAIPQIMDMSVADEEARAKVLSGFRQYRWLGFLVSPALLLLRLLLVSSCLFIGGVLDDSHPVQTFRVCYGVALRANAVQIIYSIVIFTIGLTLDAQTAIDVVNRFSLVFLLDKTIVEQWVLVPVAAFNIFEIVYWFLMAWLFSAVTNRQFRDAFRFVIISYGTGYLFYIIIVMGFLIYMM